MSILLFLILASLGLALSALLGFIWAVKTGQFEDTCTPSMRLLMDETDPDTQLKNKLKYESDDIHP